MQECSKGGKAIRNFIVPLYENKLKEHFVDMYITMVSIDVEY